MATFDIPHLEAADAEQAIGELGELDASLIAARKRAIALLNDLDTTEVTPQRLAWLVLWSQIFAAIRGVQAAVVFRSRLLLETTWRFTFEAFLHLQAIIEPALMQKDQNGEDGNEAPHDRVEEVDRRLTAFAAWCLWNDDHHMDWMMDPRTLESLGSVTERSDLEADLSALQSQRQELWELMDTDALDPWIRKMDRRRDGPEARHVYSFYELLGLETTSVSQRLIRLNSGASIGAYSRASVVLHGSSANHFLHVDAGEVTPRLMDAADVESASPPYIQVALELLGKIKPLLWPSGAAD